MQSHIDINKCDIVQTLEFLTCLFDIVTISVLFKRANNILRMSMIYYLKKFLRRKETLLRRAQLTETEGELTEHWKCRTCQILKTEVCNLAKPRRLENMDNRNRVTQELVRWYCQFQQPTTLRKWYLIRVWGFTVNNQRIQYVDLISSIEEGASSLS